MKIFGLRILTESTFQRLQSEAGSNNYERKLVQAILSKATPEQLGAVMRGKAHIARNPIRKRGES
jgi:hypothetical protein